MKLSQIIDPHNMPFQVNIVGKVNGMEISVKGGGVVRPVGTYNLDLYSIIAQNIPYGKY